MNASSSVFVVARSTCRVRASVEMVWIAVRDAANAVWRRLPKLPARRLAAISLVFVTTSNRVRGVERLRIWEKSGILTNGHSFGDTGDIMKFGMRKPSLKKMISARTSPSRFVRHSLGLKAPRGLGWLTNPKRAAYNRVYSRTTFSLWSLLKSLFGGKR